jgi:integrase
VDNQEMSREKTEPDALSVQELQRVLAAVAQTDIEGIVSIMAWTGLRPSDATDLRWREVYPERGVIKRNQIKTHNPVTIAITPEIRAVLDVERATYSDAKPQSRVFRNRDGDPITPRALYGQFTHRMAQAGLSDRVTLKILRPTFGTAAARAGVNPKALHLMLGHTDIKMTMRYYIAVSDEDLKDAQEKILKMLAHNGTPPKKPKK